MKRVVALVFMAVVIVIVVGSLWWRWHQPATVKAPTQPKPSTISQSDNFLAINDSPALTLSQILDKNFVIAAGTDMNKVYTVVTTGDIIPARGVDMQIRAQGINYPFTGQGIKDLLSKADLTVIDLEAPLTSSCPVTKDGFTFCGQGSFARAMADNGIDVATLENNHIGNYGAVGITQTKQYLTEAGIRYATRSQLDIETVKGYKIGFLAFNGVGGRFNTDEITQQVKAARSQVDVLMVAYHWGKEYEAVPMADPNIAPDDPQTIGHLTVDAGADVVIGNHPHWVQGVELYKGKVISYALGNFIFDQSWSLPTQQGMVATYTFYGPRLIGAQFTPIHIDNQAQPRLATGDEAAQIFDQFKQSSLNLANEDN